jgi:hypothetical protein
MNAVGICNLALGHLGDTATVAAIDPPDQSVQAQLCARFYPQARNTLLEMAAWNFATRRVSLALYQTNPSTTWLYAYVQPGDMISPLAVIAADAADDYSQSFYPPVKFPYPQGITMPPGLSVYVPQTYSQERSADGKTELILTNVENAVLRYTSYSTDTTQYSFLFTMALSYLLASMLAGPLIKGTEGATMGQQMMALFKVWDAQAEAGDANQRKIAPIQSVPWIVKR